MQAVHVLLCCGLVGALAVIHKDHVAQQAIKLHRGRGSAPSNTWLVNSCKRLAGLLRQKKMVVRKLSVAADAVHTLEVFQKELNESESQVFQSVVSLHRALQGDYRDVVNMKESSRLRLQALREAAIKGEEEEQEYVEASGGGEAPAGGTEERPGPETRPCPCWTRSWRTSGPPWRQMGGVNVEAVLRVEEDERDGGKRERTGPSGGRWEDDLGLSMLIDSQNNQYILTKPRDSTMPRTDPHLIKSMVQVETLGEMGVFFTLFVVGLEFSPDRLRKVWKPSVQGSCGLSLLMVAAGLLWGQALKIRATQTIFISSCLSLSSTPLVSRLLAAEKEVLLLCLLLRWVLIGPLYKKLHAEGKGNKEILVLGTCAFVFLLLSLGCFLAGALLSSLGHMVTTEVMGCIEPIRDFLAIIFFASIGLHVFPSFVLYELTVLVVLTLSLVIMKFLMGVLVLSVILPPGSRHIRWVVSAGLAQVSEFSFVLGSRARRAGIISREVYLLVLSVTTLSLLLSPLLWRATTHRWARRSQHKTLT
ncbi:hypothetical protein CRUP_025135 [Coryphaenoides rupestris]|nr:hypothetical protein CRUP_025135 [Coryphaenoides rupestris]